MGKTRDLFKKIRDTKWIFHAKMGSIKDRNGMDLTEAEDIKKSGKNIQKNCTNQLFTTQIITMVWSLTYARHPGKWSQVGLSITMNKASGGDGIPVELFQILEDNAVKVLQSICQQTWKTQQWPQDWKRSVFISIPKKSNTKECSNYQTIAFLSHASKWKWKWSCSVVPDS